MLNKMKYEVASEVGVSIGQGYNGEIKAKDAGRIGGNMVRKMIQYAESNFSGSGMTGGSSGTSGTRGGF
jgi:hypothetical protein